MIYVIVEEKIDKVCKIVSPDKKLTTIKIPKQKTYNRYLKTISKIKF